VDNRSEEIKHKEVDELDKSTKVCEQKYSVAERERERESVCVCVCVCGGGKELLVGLHFYSFIPYIGNVSVWDGTACQSLKSVSYKENLY
jgi:hypothetical protein